MVIGAFHKNDIEKNLSEQGYKTNQSSTFGTTNQQEINEQFGKQDALQESNAEFLH
ncbi:hypothetical protein MKJ01_18165 [Chryseobacterium sp. SSA4.19]|uniref:hypothetical protein n=1 Tax=Chryseobacterium sp. SSA4.19 TaxID=2919915 RepID=UPI001F4E4940|nr:hypothetical protein [Chryseobacterium sp. SSA4.19]MCJ8155683.1 hypothetical protein [Chryseobacterium sp. SSA4.19]